MWSSCSMTRKYFQRVRCSSEHVLRNICLSFSRRSIQSIQPRAVLLRARIEFLNVLIRYARSVRNGSFTCVQKFPRIFWTILIWSPLYRRRGSRPLKPVYETRSNILRNWAIFRVKESKSRELDPKETLAFSSRSFFFFTENSHVLCWIRSCDFRTVLYLQCNTDVRPLSSQFCLNELQVLPFPFSCDQIFMAARSMLAVFRGFPFNIKKWTDFLSAKYLNVFLIISVQVCARTIQQHHLKCI